MESPSFIFTTPFNVNVVEEKGIARVFLEGLVSTTDLDLVNDVVTINCLKSMQKQILDRSIKLDIEHESFRGESIEEKEINKTRVPAGKITDATVVELGEDRFGLRVKAEVNRFNQRFDEIKGNVLERYLDAYSIAFIPTKIAHVEKNGVMVRLLDDARLLNVALTGNPVNTSSLNQKVFMKAMDAVEEYKQQKLKDPELENNLIVKASPKERRTQARNEALREGDKEDEEDDEKKKKESNDHKCDKLNNRRLKMEEDQKETSGEESEKVDEATETPEAEAEAPVESAEEAPEAPAESEEVKALKSEVEGLKTEMKEIKALLSKPVHKAISETKKPTEEKTVDPLDLV